MKGRDVRLLLVEDNEGDLRLIKELLGEEGAMSFALTHAGNLSTALAKLEKDTFDVILLDLGLPESQGLDTFFKVHEKAITAPIIILTGMHDEDAASSVVRGGAQDFLSKGQVDRALLDRSIRYAIQRKKYECDLHLRNSELAMLYEISRTISLTMDLQQLFDDVLRTLVNLDVLNIEKKAGIFLLQGDRLNLVSYVGLTDSFIELHKNLRLGDCLCGRAAQSGDLVVSSDDRIDSCHTIRYEGMTPHGHVVVPVKARDKIVGVLFLYTPVGAEIDESRVETFLSIGGQLGLSIENARLYEETKELSLRDPLTGLANRRLLNVVFNRTLVAGRRGKQRCSVIMIDIDDFKKFNDTFGHTAGDNLLVTIAEIIRREIRDVDLGVRYGGEEFLVLLPETDLSSAYKVAERLKAAVEERGDVTISLGISSSDGEPTDQETLVAVADGALYRAKQKGKNRVEVGFCRGFDASEAERV